MSHWLLALAGASAVASTGCSERPAPKSDRAVAFHGRIDGDLDLSGGAVVGEFLVIASNETHALQVLKRTGDGDYTVIGDVPLAPKGTDLDIEAVAAEGNTVYATGSHGRLRKTGAVIALPTRDRVYRFPLDAEGKAGKIDTASLRKALDSDAVLKAFVPMASKENGIDIEGLAAKDGKLYFGFRGPVLREDRCPILIGEFDKLETETEVRHVRLGGRGIRDLAAIRTGFLILAGPVGGVGLDFRLYHWDGASDAVELRTVPSGPKRRPEGLIVTKDNDGATELLLLHDGVAGGDPTRSVVEWKK